MEGTGESQGLIFEDYKRVKKKINVRDKQNNSDVDFSLFFFFPAK